jgi:hypothetical protein
MDWRGEMSHPLELTHPSTLEPGKIYLRWISGILGDRLLPVEFVDYSASPAIIIIRNGFGRERCPREELYIPRAFPKSKAWGDPY